MCGGGVLQADNNAKGMGNIRLNLMKPASTDTKDGGDLHLQSDNADPTISGIGAGMPLARSPECMLMSPGTKLHTVRATFTLECISTFQRVSDLAVGR